VTRFAWLQSRTQTLIAAGLLAALAVAAAITGIQLSHLYSTLVAQCHTGCGLATERFLSHDRFMDHALDLLARAVPALLGIFWGAPLLAREFETGTYRLAWTQSVSRPRWLVTRLALGGCATVVLAGPLTLTITWWYRALDPLTTNQYAVFDRRDIAPIAYALFAFASGALIGAVIRRTVPAMAATLGVFVLVRIATTIWIRPHLLTPVRKTMSLLGAGPSGPVQLGVGSRNGGALTLFAQGEGPKHSWTLSSDLVTSSGHKLSSAQISAFLHQYCPGVGLPPAAPRPGQGVARVVGPDAGRTCLQQVAKTFHLLVTYQPADRYWAFQWLESGVYLVLALAAAVGCYWWVTRRTS
jgi:ABC-type transport system involved in multi-copper enzyme maturation permease subunit